LSDIVEKVVKQVKLAEIMSQRQTPSLSNREPQPVVNSAGKRQDGLKIERLLKPAGCEARVLRSATGKKKPETP
jgi:hypothetical protein